MKLSLTWHRSVNPSQTILLVNSSVSSNFIELAFCVNKSSSVTNQRPEARPSYINFPRTTSYMTTTQLKYNFKCTWNFTVANCRTYKSILLLFFSNGNRNLVIFNNKIRYFVAHIEATNNVDVDVDCHKKAPISNTFSYVSMFVTTTQIVNFHLTNGFILY